MLEKLLRIVSEGGLQSYAELAGRLSIPEALLEVLLQDLVRLGYLRLVQGDCDSHCSACPLGGCSVRGAGRLWTLTDSGARAAGAAFTPSPSAR